MKPLLLTVMLSLSCMAQPKIVVPLQGLDPVLLVQGKTVDGDEQYSAVRGRFKYLFVNAENQARFEKEPQRYEIQYGGTCARMGPAAGGNPDDFFVYEGKIYVFGSDECHKAFKESPASYVEPPATKWEATPEAGKQGRALLEKAVRAMGGAAPVDGLSIYQETVAEGPKTTLVFPGRVRMEQKVRPGLVVHVVTPEDAFDIAPNGRPFPMQELQRQEWEKRFARHPLAVLRARNGSGFRSAALGPARVAVDFQGLRMTLDLDPATGRVIRLSYRDRSPSSGKFGLIVREFSDFRPVEGLHLPFKIAGTVDGNPEPAYSQILQEITVNQPVEASLFLRPQAPVPGQAKQ